MSQCTFQDNDADAQMQGLDTHMKPDTNIVCDYKVTLLNSSSSEF